jgi:hypothetical protein
MDRFIAAQNIKHFRDRLRCEPDQVTRATLQNLLVQEEDKLAADLALLDDLDQEIAKCDAIIERQQALVVTIESKGSDSRVAGLLCAAIGFVCALQAIFHVIAETFKHGLSPFTLQKSIRNGQSWV